MHHGRSRLASLMVALAAGVAGIGNAALGALANAAIPPSFGQSYGGNPRSTGNGGQGRGNAARAKRAARKRANLRKHPRSRA